MESSPASGEQLKKGDTVVLTVSKGPETKPLTVPSFVTMTIDDAAAQAEAMGLKVGEHQYEYSDKPEGTVIGQSIEQGHRGAVRHRDRVHCQQGQQLR